MKTKYLNILKIFVFVVICFVSLGYAAFGAELSISNIVADVRVKSDIRITDVSITDGKYYSLDGFNYDVDSIILGEAFWELDDYLLMNVVVTNFGNTEMGIYELDVPNGIGYEVTGYKLKDKICDSQGNCNLGARKEITVKVFPIGDDGLYSSLNINFDFRKMHTVSYEGITNNGYPTSVIDGGDLNVNFTENEKYPIFVYLNNTILKSNKYSNINGNVSIDSVNGDVTFKTTNNLYNIMKLSSNGVDSNIDFSVASSETNGDGVNTFSGTENNQYPVYYYRGAVSDNNVLFANKCWKMVRTTDTGGVKLIYNGIQSGGTCNNTGTASQIGTSSFNDKDERGYLSFADTSYMYEKKPKQISEEITELIMLI